MSPADDAPRVTLSFRDAFVIEVAQAFREKYNVPPSGLKWLVGFMREPDHDHFAYAYSRCKDGMVVFLLTDLRAVFHMETDVDFEERLHYSYFRHDDDEAYYLLKINPVVNRLLTRTTAPSPLSITDEKYRLIRRGEAMSQTQNLEEMQALEILRWKGSRRVSFDMSKDRIVRAIVTRDEEPDDDFAERMGESGFEDVAIKYRHGRIEHIRRDISHPITANVDESGKRIPIVIRILD